ncbi:MAG: hypothetical protein GF341_11040 [candidate division Zixibacteria bacterium]|nr:hypothetical protein [candidate division Zixibacteria bacterium]
MNKTVIQLALAKPVRAATRIGLLLFVVCCVAPLAHGAEDSLTQSTPAFWTIDSWRDRVAPAETRPNAIIDPAGVVVKALCDYYKMPFDNSSILASHPSPLNWPRVFAGERQNPLYVKTRFERLAGFNAIAFREIVVLDMEFLGDTLMNEISDNHPVVLNHPEWPILYGYDTREPDAWWLVYRNGQGEILFESERREEYTHWSDHPAANLAWAVTGHDTQSSQQLMMDTKADAYRWLETIHHSVQGDRDHGITPYPLSIRALRDSLATATDVPTLATPVVTSDPLGIRRARRAREYAATLLERLSMQVVDTLETQPLRLALYFYHNSVETLVRLDSLMYNHSHQTIPPGRLEETWADESRRSDAIEALTDLLEWEKQAAEQIEAVVTRRSPPNDSR